jgi:transposase-like protein
MTGPGRPTFYKPEHASRARELCARGATNPDLAGRFGVARSTIGQWIANHPEFAEAVQQGRDVADATAVESLFTRVTGYNHRAEKVFLYRGEPRTATYTAHIPPETRACMF